MMDFDNISFGTERSYNVVKESMIKKFFSDEKNKDWMLTDYNGSNVAIHKSSRSFILFNYDVDHNIIELNSIGFCHNGEFCDYRTFDAHVYNTMIQAFTEISNTVNAKLTFKYDSLFFVANDTYSFRDLETIANFDHIKNIVFYFFNVDKDLKVFERLEKYAKKIDKYFGIMYNEGLEYGEVEPKVFGKRVSYQSILGMKFANFRVFMQKVEYMLKFNYYKAIQLYN